VRIIPVDKSASARSAGLLVTSDGTVTATPVYDLAQLDQVPTPKSQARPSYPVKLRTQGITGEAVVEFVVGEKGTVLNAHAVRSTHEAFAAAAVEAVAQWTFRPGRLKGRAVNTHMQVPIVF